MIPAAGNALRIKIKRAQRRQRRQKEATNHRELGSNCLGTVSEVSHVQ
jgi:hypothetical protein